MTREVPPAWAQAVLDRLGPLPGANLEGQPMDTGPKPQKGRLLKMQCDTCDLIFRITAKYIDERGELFCPDPSCGGTMLQE